MDATAARQRALAAQPWLARPSPAVVRVELRDPWWWCWRDTVRGTDRDAVLVHDLHGWVLRYPTAYAAFGLARHLPTVVERALSGEPAQTVLDELANRVAGTFVVPDG